MFGLCIRSILDSVRLVSSITHTHLQQTHFDFPICQFLLMPLIEKGFIDEDDGNHNRKKKEKEKRKQTILCINDYPKRVFMLFYLNLRFIFLFLL